jgi:hypothetical protein
MMLTFDHIELLDVDFPKKSGAISNASTIQSSKLRGSFFLAAEQKSIGEWKVGERFGFILESYAGEVHVDEELPDAFSADPC